VALSFSRILQMLQWQCEMAVRIYLKRANLVRLDIPSQYRRIELKLYIAAGVCRPFFETHQRFRRTYRFCYIRFLHDLDKIKNVSFGPRIFWGRYVSNMHNWYGGRVPTTYPSQ
jgi:hypothetical protein